MTIVPPELEEMVDQIGNFIEYWGFKNVQGRIWAHLWLSSEPLDAADLIKRLKISKALVSISMKEMIEYHVVEEAGKSERGTTLYRPNLNQEKVILNVLRKRERVMLSRISSAYNILKNMNEIDKKYYHLSSPQLSRMGSMINDTESFLDSLLRTQSLNTHLFRQLNDMANLFRSKA